MEKRKTKTVPVPGPAATQSEMCSYFLRRRRIPMSRSRCGLVVLILCLGSAPAAAESLDVLQGKFAFNWHSNPGRQKCVRIAGPLLADFKSAKYRCDLTVKTNTSSGESARTCTERNDRKEYLIFDTLRACENERKDQASNE